MDSLPLDLEVPLTQLRLYLTAAWLIAGIYAVRILRRIPREASSWNLALYSVVACFLGAGQFMLAAMDLPITRAIALEAAIALTFTPVAIILWLNQAKHKEQIKDEKYHYDIERELRS